MPAASKKKRSNGLPPPLLAVLKLPQPLTGVIVPLNKWLQHQLVMVGLFAAAVGVGILAGRTKEIVKLADASASASAEALTVQQRNVDKEMEQRLKWHWEAINKCRKEGGYAAMGFDDEVLCLRYPSLWWAYDGKGSP